MFFYKEAHIGMDIVNMDSYLEGQGLEKFEGNIAHFWKHKPKYKIQLRIAKPSTLQMIS